MKNGTRRLSLTEMALTTPLRPEVETVVLNLVGAVRLPRVHRGRHHRSNRPVGRVHVEPDVHLGAAATRLADVRASAAMSADDSLAVTPGGASSRPATP
jgi:hypothetical protein